MTDLITEARELCERATPGPWTYDGMHNEIHCLEEYFLIVSELRESPAEQLLDKFGHTYNPDFAFIARSRTLIPELCDALEKAERESGCEWCADNYDHRHKTMFRKGSDWNYEAKYCDMCGKRLEVKQND